MLSVKDLHNYAVRLEGLPWKWIQLDKVFWHIEDFMEYAAALSKDGPDQIALAIDSLDGDGYQFYNIDLGDQPELDEGFLKLTDESEQLLNLIWKERVYLPYGFVMDVVRWCEQFNVPYILTAWPPRPHGLWIDFADLTRDVAEGGDRDRWFSAHYVGPSWWVVPFPEQ